MPLLPMKFPALLAVIAIAGALTTTATGAATAQPEQESSPTLRIATRNFLPPYIYEDAKTGIEVDLVNAVFKDTGFDIEYVQLPRIRMISSFEDHQLDGILTQNVTASDTGCATSSYIEHQNVGLTVKSRHLELQSFEELRNYAVISFSGATRYLGEDFRNAVRGAKRYTESGDQGTHISLLYKGRFDVAVGDNWILRLAQKRYFDRTGEKLELEAHPIMPPSQYVARFHDQAVCDAFDAALAKIQHNGTYAEIWAGYRARIYVEAGMDAPYP
ncbi:substrate-binding periplasmic protein [Kordiimonas aestuarii]|uniref:substrate-binding periplasmic protein n=1 Tax=Kordiimonas aestuarii TaxID=1005925 RepID=UPI0021CE4400|nr:transporter substrate-binding domain-containing protein [Kordiimonas aestuarii]